MLSDLNIHGLNINQMIRTFLLAILFVSGHDACPCADPPPRTKCNECCDYCCMDTGGNVVKKGWPNPHGYCGPYNKEKTGCQCEEYLKKKLWDKDNKIGTY